MARLFRVLFAMIMALLTTSCVDKYGYFDPLGTFFLLIPVLVVAVPLIYMARDKRKDEEKALRQTEAVQNGIKSVEGFNASKVFEGRGTNTYYLAFDETSNRLLYVFEDVLVDTTYNDIYSVELLVDDSVTISKHSTMDTIGGAVIGGVLAGGVGAIIGGGSGDVTSTTQVHSIKVHVVVRNQKTASFSIECCEESCVKGSALYNKFYNKARDIMDNISLAIDKVDTENQQSIEPSPKEQRNAVQELKDLAELHKQGLLTENEFRTLKEKILNS